MKYSNGVEARIGDVCFFDNTAISITIEGERGIEALSHMVDSQEYGLLNLAHRPFQAGDEIEVCVGNDGWNEGWVNDLYHDEIADFPIRHINPLWRDHPDCVKEQSK